MTDLTDRAHEITVRRAAEAAERLALKSTDLTIAAAYIDTHAPDRLKPIADRLAGAAAQITKENQ